MQIVLGPVLRFRGAETSPARWQVSVLIVTAGDAAAPTLRWTSSAGPAGQVHGSALAASGARSVWCYALAVPRERVATSVEYELGDGRSWRFSVPAFAESPRLAYASCNGFSSLKAAKSVNDPYALWRRMSEMHAEAPYHLLLLGGDQVYADPLWETIDELVEWSESGPLLANVTPVGPGLAAQIDRFYFDLYVRRWARPEVAAMLASTPTVMMWDDHDIFDGWGSHAPMRQRSPMFQTIFAAARRWFCVFQLHGRAEAPGKEFIRPGSGLSYAHRIDDLAILALDLRSERSNTQVMGRDSWDAALAWMDAQVGLKHLLVMTSIPVVYADLELLESMLGRLPGTQELEDDLRDHWYGRSHQGERLRLVHRMLDFAERRSTRVTIVSGDVHVAAHGLISSTRIGADKSSQIVHQLIASGIVHPPAPGIVVYAMDKLLATNGAIDRGIDLAMQPMPGTRKRMLPARNWLSLEPDPSGGRGRLWARWIVEGEAEAYTMVIPPV